MKVIAVFGGSFDPPHMGHVFATQHALSVFWIDAIWWMPCYQHRFEKNLSSFRHRLRMCHLATQTFAKKYVKVSNFERLIQSDGRTLITLRRLRKEHPGHRFQLMIGSDVLRQRQRWYGFKTIEREFGVMVVPRGGNTGIPPISSSAVRQRLRRGLSCRGLLPRAVAQYGCEHRLYA